jgi:hypothetical protein
MSESKHAAPTAEDIQSLKAKYPGAELFKAEFEAGVVLVFRRPTADEFDYFWDNFDPSSHSAAGPAREFVELCVIWPDAAAFQSLSKKYASLAIDMLTEIRKRTGAGKAQVAAL